MHIQPRKPKREVAYSLGIKERTFYNYLAIAENISGFESDYPTVRGQNYTRVGLTDYQIWVVSAIAAYIRNGAPIESLYVEEKIDGKILKYIDPEIDEKLSRQAYEFSIKSLAVIGA